MDLDQARLSFNAPTLSGAVPARREGEVDIPAVPAVTLLSLRVAGVNIIGVERNTGRVYGMLSTKDFFNAVFKADPIYEQMVALRCNAGCFRSKASNTNLVKMLQLLSFRRLGKDRLLSQTANIRQSQYQMIAMAKGLAPHLPEEWRLAQQATRTEVIRAVLWFMSVEGSEMIGLEQ